MSSSSSSRCGCCLKLLLSLGCSALVLWLVYRPIAPRYYITSFSATTNATFTLQIENKNRERGIYHDSLSVSLSPNLTTVIPAFYQGKQKTANKPATITGGAASWMVAVANGSAVFKVAVDSSFRYKVVPWNWKSGRHAVRVAGEVAVDAGGEKTAKKGIRLSSASSLAVNGIVRIVSLAVLAYCLAAL